MSEEMSFAVQSAASSASGLAAAKVMLAVTVFLGATLLFLVSR
jgi:hypothetical protein